MSLENLSKIHGIILFDGVCHLCEGSVFFIIKRDTKDVFRFAALQSQVGQALLNKFGLSRTDFDTMVLFYRDRYYLKSSAALRIAGQLNGAWPMISIFLLVPRFLRDAIYGLIAKNRYRWFGKKEACIIPTPDLKKKFIDGETL